MLYYLSQDNTTGTGIFERDSRGKISIDNVDPESSGILEARRTLLDAIQLGRHINAVVGEPLQELSSAAAKFNYWSVGLLLR